MRKEIQRHKAKNNPGRGRVGVGARGCLIKSVIHAAAEADRIAHVRQTPSYPNQSRMAWKGSV